MKVTHILLTTDLSEEANRGRTGVRRLMLGSIAETVRRHAGIPVLCVPQTKN